MVSNIVAILSVTLFVLNVSTCLWYTLSCDNFEKGGTCQSETWIGSVHHLEGGEKYCCNSMKTLVFIIIRR